MTHKYTDAVVILSLYNSLMSRLHGTWTLPDVCGYPQRIKAEEHVLCQIKYDNSCLDRTCPTGALM